MSHAAQLERETERTRAELADTLSELRASMAPGRLFERLTDQVTHGAAAEYTRNLKDQAVANPIPLAMVGAGLAWLMLSSRSKQPTVSNSAAYGRDAYRTGTDGIGSGGLGAERPANDTEGTDKTGGIDETGRTGGHSDSALG